MILDIVLLVIIALSVFLGYRQGFVKVIIKLGTFILAIVLAFALQNSVANFIGDKLGIKNNISLAVEEKLLDFADNDEAKEEKSNIPVIQNVINEINSATEENKQEVVSQFAEKVTNFMLNGISFIVIFLVVSITMGIIGMILGMIVKLPVLKTLNGVLGASSSFVLILLRILILLAIISILSPLEVLSGVTKYIETSCITRWLYENNIIINILGRKIL